MLPAIEDEAYALRLVWFSEDFDRHGDLKAAAFSKKDILPKLDRDGKPSYVSMDLEDLVSKSSVDWNIKRGQAQRSLGGPERASTRFAKFNCGSLRSVTTIQGAKMFRLQPFPVEANEIEEGSPPNPAHIGVCSFSPAPEDEARQEEKIVEVRNRLLELCRGQIVNYATLFRE